MDSRPFLVDGLLLNLLSGARPATCRQKRSNVCFEKGGCFVVALDRVDELDRLQIAGCNGFRAKLLITTYFVFTACIIRRRVFPN